MNRFDEAFSEHQSQLGTVTAGTEIVPPFEMASS